MALKVENKKKKLTTIVCGLGLLVWTVLAVNQQMPALFGQGGSAEAASAEIAGSIIITDQSEEVVDVAKGDGVEVRSAMPARGSMPSFVVVAEEPDHPKVKALANRDDVTAVMPNYAYQTFFTPNDPEYSEQWNMPKIAAPGAWDIDGGGENITIAVIDTGILFTQTIDGTTYSQPDFPQERKWINPAETGVTQEGNSCWTGAPEDKQSNNCDDSGNGLIDDWQGWDFMGGWRGDSAACPNHNDPASNESPTDPNYIIRDNDPQAYSCDSPISPSTLNKNHYNGTCVIFESACYVGHGTMVASVAGAATNNSQLIAGLDHTAKLMNIRVLDGYGYGTTDLIGGGIHYAAENGADVINLSLGSNCNDESFSDPFVEAAIQAAVDSGAVIVAASGNSNLGTVCYPASSPQVIAVGATGTDDKRNSYSSYSNKLDVVAPAGVPVANAPSSHINSNYYANAHGTSLSTPHVAGLAGLLKSAQPEITRSETRHIIRSSADKVAGMQGASFHKEYGYGRINALKAVKQATIIHPDGALIKAANDHRVFLVENGQRRHIASPEVFTSHGYVGSQIKPATVSDMQLASGQSLNYREGTLVKGSGGSIYVINYVENVIEKRHIGSMKVFEGLGYTVDEIITIPNSALPVIDGAAISTASVHPDGALVKSSSDHKVFLVENSQRRHVSSMEVFTSHGYKGVQIKSATAGDMQSALGQSLNYREGTLVKGSGSSIYVINYAENVIEKRHVLSAFVLNLLFPSSNIMQLSDDALPATNGTPVN